MYEHFKGEEVFVKKVLEYVDQAIYRQRCICTKFLNPYHRSIVKSIVGNNEELVVLEEGLIEGSESKKVIIAPSFYQIRKEDFSIVLVKIGYAKHFDTLQHKDVLGALMSLGVKRELFGDIVEHQDDFYLAIDEAMYPFVKENITKIKRSKVHISRSDEIVSNVQEYAIKSFIVSSVRLDKVVASFYKIPRNKAVEYIQSGFVKVNHKEVVEIHYLCNNKDIISLKRHGRVLFMNTGRITKSDNYVVEGYFYK